MALFSYISVFWALSSGFLAEVAAAAAFGFINSIANLGGFVGKPAARCTTMTLDAAKIPQGRSEIRSFMRV